MTDKNPGEVLLVAVSNVSIDGEDHAPGAVFEASEENARALIAADAATPAEDAGDGNLEDVKGIGPKTAGKLKAVGLEHLEALAELDDDDVARLAKVLDEGADTVAAWRDQARTLRQV